MFDFTLMPQAHEMLSHADCVVRRPPMLHWRDASVGVSAVKGFAPMPQSRVRVA